jgi:superfamily II DNA or RNA helicase
MKDEEWFSKGIALSEPCNISIVNNSLEKLEMLRQSGTRHQLIAVACSIHHAQQIRSLYSERGYNAEVIHSFLKTDEKDRIIRDLKNGTLDCIVQVQMLGEGFDHPKLSVAAVFNPFRSLAPYIQFVGRIMRVIVQNDPIHPDNYGYIVTHIGLNLDEQLKRFKDFENDDKSFWEEMTSGEEEDVSREVLSGEKRQRLGEQMVVSREIVDTLFEEDFTAVEDADILAELERKFKILGIDPALAKQVFEQHKASQSSRDATTKAAEPFSIQPQRQWKEAKKRLNEDVKRVAKLILNTCDLKMVGVEIPYKLKLGTSAKNNFVCAVELVNKKVNDLVPEKKSREQWTLEELQKATVELPKIQNAIVRNIKKAQNVETKG